MLLFFAFFVAGTRAASYFPFSNTTTNGTATPTARATTTSLPANSSLESNIQMLIADIQNPFVNVECTWIENETSGNLCIEGLDEPVSPAGADCSNSFRDTLSTWASSIAKATPGTSSPTAVAASSITPPSISGRNASIPVLGDRTSQHVFSPEGPNPYPGADLFTWTASGPCCNTCSIFGGTVQVYYWPSTVSAQPSGVATVVDSIRNFTFTSPSVYVAFQSLYATDLCGELGNQVSSTTIAFGLTDLSTTIGYRWDTSQYASDPPQFYGSGGPTFTAAVWNNQISCGERTESFWQKFHQTERYSDIGAASSAFARSYRGSFDMKALGTSYTVTYNPCSPTISVPKSILTLNPKWTDCVPGISGFFDPPSTLTPGTGFKTDGPFASQPSQVPSPGPSPAPAIATQTSDPSPKQTPATVNSAGQPASTNNPPASGGSPANNSPASNNPPANIPPSVNNPPASNAPASSVQNNQPASNNPPVNPPVSNVQNNQPASINVPVNNPPASNNPPNIPTLSSGPAVVQAPATGPAQTNPPSLPVITPVPVKATIDGSMITANPSSAFVIASQTLTPGSIITHSGTPYSLASNGASLVVGGSSTQVLADPSSPAYVVGSQTLVPGAAALTVSGTPISLQTGALSVVFAGSTLPISALIGSPSNGPNIQILGQPSSPTYVVGSQTLIPGAAAITVSGTPISLQPGASGVVIGGSTLPVNALTSSLANGLSVQVINPVSPTYIIGSQTLAPGSAALTLSGTPISLQPGGSSVIIGSKTFPISAFISLPTNAASVIIGDQTEALSAVLADITGSPSLISGGSTQALSVKVGPNGSPSVVVGDKTEALSAFATGAASVVIGTKTLALSAFLGEVTSGASVVVDGKTTALSAGLVGGLDSVIAIATMKGPGPSTSSYVQVGGAGQNGTRFVGGAGRMTVDGRVWIMGMVAGIGVLGALIL